LCLCYSIFGSQFSNKCLLTYFNFFQLFRQKTGLVNIMVTVEVVDKIPRDLSICTISKSRWTICKCTHMELG